MIRRSIVLTLLAAAFLLVARAPASSTPIAEPPSPPSSIDAEVLATFGDGIFATPLSTDGLCTPTKCELREAICQELCTCPRGDGVKNFHCENIGGRCTITCQCYAPTSCPI